MADTSRMRLLFLRHFSKPAIFRPIYQAIAKRRISSILELGLGTGERAMRMIEAALAHTPPEQVRYTGVDLFEARPHPAAPGITLKKAHRSLHATGVPVRLVPGDPFSALARVANTLGPTDLIVVSDDQDPAAIAKAWFYVPRILHSDSLVLIETRSPSGEMAIREIVAAEIGRLASAGVRRKAA